jgi:hypothetical protein
MSPQDSENALRDVLAHPDSVLFVGSGLSTWSGLPDWSQLLTGLIVSAERRNANTLLARDALARGDLLDTADKLADLMTPLEMIAILRTELGFAKARPHEIHQLLTNLGPERFVTTNFDNLIEQQLGLEGRLGEFRTVTNRQVAELADIQKASANKFIFKPHGDLAEAESLVLSATQYNRILLGSANLIRPVLETLFVSRPVLFIGYGLRDPDMMLLLQSLKERYNGNAGELWAIVADANQELVSYWWRQHRIHIIGYATDKDTAVKHEALLGLLRRLSRAVKTHHSPSKQDRQISDISHGLLRYAARLIKPTAVISFEIEVAIRDWFNRARFPDSISKFHRSHISKLLAKCTESFVLEGPAGSGKSFAISERLSHAGRELLDWCLDEDQKKAAPPIPILLDARLYTGDFTSLIAATVPTSLDLPAASQIHTIVLIIDSLDEMPAEHLDAAKWRSELELLVSSLQDVRVQFGTRRSDLVSDPTLPVFFVRSLDREIVEANLRELGRSTEDITLDLFEALKTPYTLTLGRRLLGSNRDISSAPALFSRFIDRALKSVVGYTSTPQILECISGLASGVLASGYDTLSIAKAADTFKRAKTPAIQNARWLIDRLVGAGIFVSEINDHVRFVHRSITEFLAAIYLVNEWRNNAIKLDQVLTVRRWDNAAAWASTLLTQAEANLFMQQVYIIDRELAATIADAAEVGKDRLWSTLLELLIAYPPSDEQQRDFVQSAEDSEVPENALPKLRALTHRDDDLGGWAMALLVPSMSEEEITAQIDRLSKGQFGYNFMNYFGPAFGKRIEGYQLEYLLSTFEVKDFDGETEGDESEANIRLGGYSAVIGGLLKPARDRLLKWSQRKSGTVRGIVCNGIQDIDDDISVQNYLVRQLDRRVREAIFGIYLGMKYKGNVWRWWTPKCTTQRVSRLIDLVKTGDGHQRWTMALLKTLADRDDAWRGALIEFSISEKNQALKRVVRALATNGGGNSAAKIFSRALDSVESLTPVERLFCCLADDLTIELDEERVLRSMKRDPRNTLRLFGDIFFTTSYDRRPIKIHNISEWISVLDKSFQREEWTRNTSLLSVCGYLANAMQITEHKVVLDCANDLKNPASDFVLGLIVPRVPGVTTDDLTSAAASRLLDLYVKVRSISSHHPVKSQLNAF